MDAIFGVIGTILGTILGWVLNSISNNGKLNIYASSWADNFESNEAGSMIPSLSKDQAEFYSCQFTLDLYNSSGSTKIMRNVKIIYNDGNRDIHTSVPKDSDTRRNVGAFWTYDDMIPVNIPPKTIIQLNLRNASNEFDYIWKTKKIYIAYVNEKNKVIRVAIKSEDYSRYFENHKQ